MTPRRDPAPRPAAAAPREGGFTIMELMVVVVLMGLILGAGIGAFASFDPGSSAARGMVVNTLRQARNEAVAHRAPARVVFDPADGSLVAQGYRVVGTWRFEDARLSGAGGVNGSPEGFPDQFLSDDGFIGRALDLDLGGRGSRVAMDLTEDPAFAVTHGFRLSLALRPARLADGQVLDLGGVVGLHARRDGALEVEVTTRRVDELGRARAGEKIRMRTAEGLLEPERWSQFELRYDRRRLVALVNGVPVAERGETRPLWELSAALSVGGGRERFPGRVDDLVLATATDSVELRLPDRARFLAPGPFEVRFDEGGRLDPVAHGGPVTIEIELGDGRTTALEVLAMGTVE